MCRRRITMMKTLTFCLLAIFSVDVFGVEFNTDLLSVDDKSNIDFSSFSEPGFILPGTYLLTVYINKHALGAHQSIKFIASGNESIACLTIAQVEGLGLLKEYFEDVAKNGRDGCYDIRVLEGVNIKGDLSTESLYISIPPKMLEYHDVNWLPPVNWENGLSGMILDYNANLSASKNYRSSGSQNQTANLNGTLGANIDAWRLRGDYQGNYRHVTGSAGSSQYNFDWSRFYAYRALPNIRSELIIGEDNLSSDIFDSWRYVGISLASDQKQIPPALRGYAPEVTGIARTNATVTVSQQGRVIYETVVAAGPFTIRELSSSANGLLDVDITEQDGTTQHYQVVANSLPYMTRAGQTQYSVALGKPENRYHHATGDNFVTGELSRGLSGLWSVYGGTILSDSYKSIALGIVRNLGIAGVMSADITHADTVFNDSSRKGQSYRLKYYKNFEDISSTFTLSGVQYSESDFFSMSDYINYKNEVSSYQKNKTQYGVTFTKNFKKQRMSASMNFLHKTYWGGGNNDSYTLSLNKYFDFHSWKNITLSLSAIRNNYYNSQDDMLYLNMSIPFGNGTASYSSNYAKKNTSQVAGWYQQLASGDSYRLQAGGSKEQDRNVKAQLNGFYYHYGSMSNMSGNVSWREDEYSSAGLSVNGGITATSKGVAMHPAGNRGSTRVMISTDGIPDVPVGKNLLTNAFGIAVQSGVSSYSRVRNEIDVTRLPDDIEVIGPPVMEGVLTEGAIGFRTFKVIKGQKIVAILRQSNGNPVPFGASVLNKSGIELGIAGDNGYAWLPGVNGGEELTVSWEGDKQCRATLPGYINQQDSLLLPCIAL